MRTLIFSELLEVRDRSLVAYCYSGKKSRGSIAMFYDDTLTIVKPSNYFVTDSSTHDISDFELWAFIHEMVEEKDFEIRDEAVNRFFDVYCGLYQSAPILHEYPFITE